MLTNQLASYNYVKQEEQLSNQLAKGDNKLQNFITSNAPFGCLNGLGAIVLIPLYQQIYSWQMGYYCTFTVYRETLTKGKFDEFDESWLNRQTKTI